MTEYNLNINKAFDSFEYEQLLLQSLSALLGSSGRQACMIETVADESPVNGKLSALGTSYHTSCRAQMSMNEATTQLGKPFIGCVTLQYSFENMEDRQHNDAVKSEYAKTLPILRQNPQLDMQVLPNVLAASIRS